MNPYINKLIEDVNNLNIYIFGSHLYGTQNENSDIDIIIIQKEFKKVSNPNVQCYVLQTFVSACEQGEISCLEAFYGKKILKETVDLPLTINIDFGSFRRIVSTLTSNSWVKGKKKLTLLEDYDLNAGLKSIFHCLRVLDYSIQIGEQGNIYDFERNAFILTDLYKLSNKYQNQELWNIIDQKYRSDLNQKKSRFKILFPIDKKNEKSQEIKSILLRYDCFNEDLFHELKALL
jgi:predicted nucleotidyltransferase